jgi:tripartite-type tricarboxylate transporter receptor subunit TctC
MIDRRDFTRLFASALAPAAFGAPTFAQAPSPAAWPNRFVRLIVPFPAGGGTDAVARILANRLSEVWGQQMVIENKGGAGSNIGAEAVARSEPDGYTVLIGSLPLAVNRYLYSSLNYDPLTDFAPVTLICIYPNLMVPNSSPAKSVPEFIAHAKANPGKITFASSGTGTSTHLSGELFKRMTGIEMTHVPYRGVAPALNDVIPGRVDVMFNTMAGVLQHARSGQVRGLAVTSAKRFPTGMEFPTVAESGVPGFDVSAWYAFFAPAKTPLEIVNKVNADTVAILREPAVIAAMEKAGVAVIGSTPAELARMLKSEIDLWGPVIKAAGIKSEE